MKKGLIVSIAIAISSDFYPQYSIVPEIQTTESYVQEKQNKGETLKGEKAINALIQKLKSEKPECNLAETILKLSNLKHSSIYSIHIPGKIIDDKAVPVWIISSPFSDKIQEEIYLTLEEIMEILQFDVLCVQHPGNELSAKDLIPPGWYEQWKNLDSSQKKIFGKRRVMLNKANGSEMFEVSMDDKINTYGWGVDTQMYDITMAFNEDMYIKYALCRNLPENKCPLPHTNLLNQKIGNMKNYIRTSLDSLISNIENMKSRTNKPIAPFVADYHIGGIEARLKRTGPYIILMPGSFKSEMIEKWKDSKGRKTGYKDFWIRMFIQGHRRFKLKKEYLSPSNHSQ